LKREVENERKVKEKAEHLCLKYRCMSRTYWERWRWELQQRREAMIRERMVTKERSIKLVLPNIDPSMLEDPVVDGQVPSVSWHPSCCKRILPRSLVHDVTNEANLLGITLSSLPSLSVWCLCETKAI
jgi:hypothetical protein